MRIMHQYKRILPHSLRTRLSVSRPGELKFIYSHFRSIRTCYMSIERYITLDEFLNFTWYSVQGQHKVITNNGRQIRFEQLRSGLF